MSVRLVGGHSAVACSYHIAPSSLRVTDRRECFQRPRVILSTRGSYPLWLRIAIISAHVEVLRRKQGAYSGIKVVCISICIGRDAPFGAKPPQAGSTESLIYLSEAKELFHQKECKFAYVGVDQTRRRPLAVSLFRNCCGRQNHIQDFGAISKSKTSTPQAFLIAT